MTLRGDDFTAIPGVRPEDAKDLRTMGLRTYDDLRQWPEAIRHNMPHRVTRAIRNWLKENPA
jgi:predicted flap endonuclease-1-like 5' DNA nuclease